MERLILWCTSLLGSIPHFCKRAALTHELFDLITELRLTTTSGGIAENIKRESQISYESMDFIFLIFYIELHLLEYKQRMLEYLSYFMSVRKSPFKKYDLRNFSLPMDVKGYSDSFLTDDLITDIYLDFTAKVWKSESVEYCKTRTGEN
jgi:hypothetical protein